VSEHVVAAVRPSLGGLRKFDRISRCIREHRCDPALLYHLRKDRVKVRFVVCVFMLELTHEVPPLARSCWYDLILVRAEYEPRIVGRNLAIHALSLGS
jgi:hypothetical protein